VIRVGWAEIRVRGNMAILCRLGTRTATFPDEPYHIAKANSIQIRVTLVRELFLGV